MAHPRLRLVLHEKRRLLLILLATELMCWSWLVLSDDPDAVPTPSQMLQSLTDLLLGSGSDELYDPPFFVPDDVNATNTTLTNYTSPSPSPEMPPSPGLADATTCYVMGRNANGQLGLGDTQDRDNPTLLVSPNGHSISRIALGTASTAFIAGTECYVMGSNGRGQLGLGDYIDRSSPQLLKSPNGKVITDVAMGQTSGAFLADGELYVMGSVSCLVDDLPPNTPQLLRPLNGQAVHAFALGTCDLGLATAEHAYVMGDNVKPRVPEGEAQTQTHKLQLLPSPNEGQITAIAVGPSAAAFKAGADWYIYGSGGLLGAELRPSTDPLLLKAPNGMQITAVSLGIGVSAFLAGDRCFVMGGGFSAGDRPRVIGPPSVADVAVGPSLVAFEAGERWYVQRPGVEAMLWESSDGTRVHGALNISKGSALPSIAILVGPQGLPPPGASSHPQPSPHARDSPSPALSAEPPSLSPSATPVLSPFPSASPPSSSPVPVGPGNSCANWFGDLLGWESIPYPRISDTAWGLMDRCTRAQVAPYGPYRCAVHTANGSFIPCAKDCRDGACVSSALVQSFDDGDAFVQSLRQLGIIYGRPPDAVLVEATQILEYQDLIFGLYSAGDSPLPPIVGSGGTFRLTSFGVGVVGAVVISMDPTHVVSALGTVLLTPSNQLTPVAVLSVTRFDSQGNVISNAPLTFVFEATRVGALEFYRFPTGATTGTPVAAEGGTVLPCVPADTHCSRVTSPHTSVFVAFAVAPASPSPDPSSSEPPRQPVPALDHTVLVAAISAGGGVFIGGLLVGLVCWHRLRMAKTVPVGRRSIAEPPASVPTPAFGAGTQPAQPTGAADAAKGLGTEPAHASVSTLGVPLALRQPANIPSPLPLPLPSFSSSNDCVDESSKGLTTEPENRTGDEGGGTSDAKTEGADDVAGRSKRKGKKGKGKAKAKGKKAKAKGAGGEGSAWTMQNEGGGDADGVGELKAE